MYCRLLAAALCLAALSCTRAPAPGRVERLTILRFENLGADSSADWMGRAFSDILTAELSGAPGMYALPSARLHGVDQLMGRRPVAAPGISAERALALAAGATRIGYGEYSVRGGKIEARLVVEDPQARRMTQVATASAAAPDIVGAATALARQISARTVPYDTQNSAAVRAFIGALESQDPQLTLRYLEESIAADPNFGEPYRAMAQVRAQQNDRAGGLAILEQALARGSAMPPAERGRIEVEVAAFRNDPAARQRALENLAKLDAGDPGVWRLLGQSSAARRDYKQAVEAFRRTLAIEPDDAATWNQLGYVSAYAGDLNGAMDALRRYQSLRPADRNPLDSMGDVNLLHGRLREAENFYLDAAKKDPSFAAGAEFFKAAMARLMTGDLPGADALAQKYAEVRHRIEGPAGGSFDAEWLWISGRRQAACERLGQFARASETASLRDVAARAWAELAIWNLMLGDRTAADAAVGKAMSLATPKSANVAMLARFLAEPSAGAAEWQERIDRLFPGPDPGNLKELGLAYALLLSKQFQDALPVLERVNARTNAAAEESVPILLAWALLETGRTADAEPLLKWNPIPPPNGVNPFASFFFPRIYYLRGLAAEKSGRPDAARSDYALFLKLSGSTPLMWGEEKKAAAR